MDRRQLLEPADEAIEADLPLVELAAPPVLAAEGSHDRVDDDEAVRRVLLHQRRHGRGGGLEDVRRGGVHVRDVGEDVFDSEVEALGDGGDALHAEAGLGVDVEDLARGAALLDGELARDAERRAELGLAAPGAAEELKV